MPIILTRYSRSLACFLTFFLSFISIPIPQQLYFCLAPFALPLSLTFACSFAYLSVELFLSLSPHLLPAIYSRGHATLHLTVSVGPSVVPSVTFLNSERFSQRCSCPTVRDWIAVYPALFFLRFHFFSFPSCSSPPCLFRCDKAPP